MTIPNNDSSPVVVGLAERMKQLIVRMAERETDRGGCLNIIGLFSEADSIATALRTPMPARVEPAIPAGMKVWGPDSPGYPNQPEDWEGGPYLCRDGKLYHMCGYDWGHGTNCLNAQADWDRVAYTPRPSEPAIPADERERALVELRRAQAREAAASVSEKRPFKGDDAAVEAMLAFRPTASSTDAPAPNSARATMALRRLWDCRPDNWKDCRDDDPDQLDAWEAARRYLTDAPARVGEGERALREGLELAKRAILKAAKDTLWCDDSPAETVVDRIDALLAEADGQQTLALATTPMNTTRAESEGAAGVQEALGICNRQAANATHLLEREGGAWRPTRAHYEGLRNALQNAAGELQRATAIRRETGEGEA